MHFDNILKGSDCKYLVRKLFGWSLVYRTKANGVRELVFQSPLLFEHCITGRLSRV